MKHPDVERVLWENTEIVSVSWKQILVDGHVRAAYDSMSLWDDQMLAVEFLCKAKTFQAVTRTSLATWTENPNSLSDDLKGPLEILLKSNATRVRELIGDAHRKTKVENTWWNVPGDIRDVPHGDELLKAFVFWPTRASEETQRVQKFLQEHAHVVMDLIGDEASVQEAAQQAA